jgi:hypothetical protein
LPALTPNAFAMMGTPGLTEGSVVRLTEGVRSLFWVPDQRASSALSSKPDVCKYAR